MALTKRAIDALKHDPTGKRLPILWDGSLPGFGVRVFESGAKSFILDYRASGRKRRITLGRYGVLTPDQGRRKAVAELAKINAGADPAEERRTAHAASSLREFAKEYIERHAEPRKRSWGEDQRRLDKYVLPALGSLALGSVTRADVTRLHDKIGKRAPFEANRVLALVGVMYSLAGEWGYLPDGFANPTARVKAFDEPSRDRWVKPDELPALWAAIMTEENPYVRALCVLALLLGCRRSELLRAEWANVDLTRAELRLPNTKAGNTHTLPLSPRAVELLSALPRMLGNPHVFPSPVEPGEPMKDVKRQWKRIRTAAGLDDVRFHDLRRTVGSWLATSGASLHLIGAVLNHADTDTTKIYARLTETATRTALQSHADAIYKAVGVKAG